MLFDLSFPDTYVVSSEQVPDTLLVTFPKPWYFVGQNTFQILVSEDTELTSDIPKQFPSEGQKEIAESIS